MPRGRRASGTKHKVESWEDLYYEWWVSGCNIEQILTLYHLYDKTKSNGTPTEIWQSNKYNHKTEYQNAKTRYFQSLGVTRECLVLRLNDLSLNARSEMVRLDATRSLYEILDKAKDSSAVKHAEKIIIQVEGSPNPSAIVSNSDNDIQEE